MKSIVCIILVLAVQLLPARGDAILLITQNGPETLSVGDQAIKRRLEGMGHAVTLTGKELLLESANGKNLIFISESVHARRIGAIFREVPIPCVVSDSHIFPGMGMTGMRNGSDFGFVPKKKGEHQTIEIVDLDHPMVAGRFTGKMKVFDTPVTFHYGVPSSEGKVIATAPNDWSRPLLFAYEVGARMFGTKAPARRVGLFVRDHHNNARHFTDVGGKLFEAAINWALGKPQTVSHLLNSVRTGPWELRVDSNLRTD